MEPAFGASDATGAWDWKTAYDACEVATVLFLRKYGKPLFRKATSPALRLSALSKIAALLPTRTRRSEESQAFQQFSTPILLGLAAATAAAITPADRVLERSADTGLLAILNEFAELRADLLASLFPAVPVTRLNAAQIDDHLDPDAVPSVVLMNPSVLGAGACRRSCRRRRAPPYRLGAGIPHGRHKSRRPIEIAATGQKLCLHRRLGRHNRSTARPAYIRGATIGVNHDSRRL